jgi:DNA-binding response OmpR family regulator
MKSSPVYILLVEDDKNLGIVIQDFLQMSGYKVRLEKDGIRAYQAFEEEIFDLCILDVMMPFRDGFALARDIRKKDAYVPIVFLTARKMDEDRIRGFQVGADDYLTKPFVTEELVLRIQAILRRTGVKTLQNKMLIQSVGNYTFDYENQVLRIEQLERHLTRREAEVLQLLCRYRGKVLTRKHLLTCVWGNDDYFAGRSLDVYITRIRKLFKEDQRIAIMNIHGKGYKLEIKDEEHGGEEARNSEN